MTMKFSIKSLILRSALALSIVMGVSGCISTIVGEAVDVSLEVAKVPFKVAGAVVDVVTGDDDKKK